MTCDKAILTAYCERRVLVRVWDLRGDSGRLRRAVNRITTFSAPKNSLWMTILCNAIVTRRLDEAVRNAWVKRNEKQRQGQIGET